MLTQETSQDKVHNTLYPVFLKLENLETLIVGGGDTGAEKVRFILKNSPEARIRVVGKTVKQEIVEYARQYPGVRVQQREFRWDDLLGTQFLILATGDRSLDKEIRAVGKRHNILVNVADVPDLCDLYLGSIVTRGDLKIAISSNGKSPTLTKRIRQLLEEVIPMDTQRTLDNLHTIRERLKGAFAYKVKVLNSLTEGLLRPARKEGSESVKEHELN